MSRVKELAEAEAARAESESESDEADESESDEPESESDEPDESESDEPAEPAEAAGPSQAQLDAFEREVKRHEQALARITGGDWAHFYACAVCAGVGFLAMPPVLPDPKSERCPDCKGHGRFASDSLVTGKEFRACLTCGGEGVITKLEVPVAPAQAFAPAAAAPPLPPPPYWDGEKWVTPSAPPGNGYTAAPSYAPSLPGTPTT